VSQRPAQPVRALGPRAASTATLPAMLLATLLIVALAGCAGTDSTRSSGSGSAGDARYVAGDGTTQVIKPAERRAAPAITGTTFEAKPYRLSDHRGKTVVVNFWASWCAPCRAEAPAFQQLSVDHKGKGVEFVGVDIKDGKQNAQAFLRTFKITYPSLYDQPGEIALAFRETVPPNAIPSTIIIDRQGRVAARIIGPATHSALRRLVAQIAAER